MDDQMTDDLRTRLAAVAAAHKDQCGDCLCGWESWEESWVMHLADAVIRELTNPIRGCTDPWHWSTGEPYRCPSCGYWMGEGYV